MKNIRVIMVLIICWSSASAQNTFPTPSGNVGIGTTAPDSKLHISSSSYKNFLILDRTSHSNMQNVFHLTPSWDLDKNDQLRIGTGSIDIISFEETGNVGIGTKDPSKSLHIASNTPSFLLERIGSTSWETRVDNNGKFIIQDASNSTEPLKIEPLAPTGTIYAKSNGHVGIGTADPKSRLAVNGEIRATKVKVLGDISVPDYVFEESYKLRTLQETKEYITANKHLPEIPSAAEIGNNGFDLGDMDMRLLKKIEELTIQMIRMDEELKKIKDLNIRQQQELDAINKN